VGSSPLNFLRSDLPILPSLEYARRVNQPLTTSAFWILTVLASGRRHGYDILSETRTASEGRVSLKVATLYAALERLESEGSIRADGDEIVSGRARRYYVLTDQGVTRLDAEARAMAQAAKAAQHHLGTRPAVLSTATVTR
jgi:DNA-binding PadR family transcriptional regulator